MVANELRKGGVYVDKTERGFSICKVVELSDLAVFAMCYREVFDQIPESGQTSELTPFTFAPIDREGFAGGIVAYLSQEVVTAEELEHYRFHIELQEQQFA